MGTYKVMHQVAPPSPKLTATSSMEDMAKFCYAFDIYIKGGKIMKEINLLVNVVLGVLAQCVESMFFTTTLHRFILNNIPEESNKVPTEERVVEYIYHYFA